jgi:hypothetical protein
MKVGDKIPVTVAGAEVAQAEVKEVGDGTVTFIVPAKRVVMSVRTELDPLAEAPTDTSGTQTIIDEVVRNTGGTGATVENAGETGTEQQSTAPVEVDAAKVLTSSSVPGPNDAATDAAKFEALDPAVQAQITEIVNAHLAAQAATQAEAGNEPSQD